MSTSLVSDAPTFDALLSEAAALSEEALSSAPVDAVPLSRLFENADFLQSCSTTLGQDKFAKIKTTYDEICQRGGDENELVSQVVIKYGAPHLRPTEKWTAGGASCWSLYNLMNYSNAVLEKH